MHANFCFFFTFVDTSDVKASIAVLEFILSSAARYDVESSPLSDELQQLGLPKGRSLRSSIRLSCRVVM